MLAFLMETESEGFVTVIFVSFYSDLTDNLPIVHVWTSTRLNYL